MYEIMQGEDSVMVELDMLYKMDTYSKMRVVSLHTNITANHSTAVHIACCKFYYIERAQHYLVGDFILLACQMTK